jgi:hypothetical protein
LNGAKPSALLVLQPNRFELVTNPGVAKVLGITIPPVMLVQAASAKLGDFPVKQPTQIELAVSLRTVKALSRKLGCPTRTR